MEQKLSNDLRYAVREVSNMLVQLDPDANDGYLNFGDGYQMARSERRRLGILLRYVSMYFDAPLTNLEMLLSDHANKAFRLNTSDFSLGSVLSRIAVDETKSILELRSDMIWERQEMRYAADFLLSVREYPQIKVRRKRSDDYDMITLPSHRFIICDAVNDTNLCELTAPDVLWTEQVDRSYIARGREKDLLLRVVNMTSITQRVTLSLKKMIESFDSDWHDFTGHWAL